MNRNELIIETRIPDGRDTRDELYPGRDYSKFRSEELSWEAETEFVMLEHLTKKGCKSVPHLIGYSVDKQPKDGYVPGGYIVYVIMEKVPGHDLWDFGKYPLEKRDQIRIAFGKAIRYVLVTYVAFCGSIADYEQRVLFTWMPAP